MSRIERYSGHNSRLAATAAHTGFTLVTRNIAYFEHTGITLLNPWHLQK